MSGRRQLVYSYEGERDPGLERRVAAMFPGAHTGEVQSGLQGVTEVTLDLPGDPPADRVEALRALPRILDAAAGSLGEGV